MTGKPTTDTCISHCFQLQAGVACNPLCSGSNLVRSCSASMVTTGRANNNRRAPVPRVCPVTQRPLYSHFRLYTISLCRFTPNVLSYDVELKSNFKKKKRKLDVSNLDLNWKLSGMKTLIILTSLMWHMRLSNNGGIMNILKLDLLLQNITMMFRARMTHKTSSRGNNKVSQFSAH